MNRLVRWIAMVVLALPACDFRTPYPETGPDNTLTLRVINQSLNHVDIYAVHGTDRQRVIHLCELGRAEIEMGEPWLSRSDIVFVADAISSEGTYVLGPIEVIGDTYVVLTLLEDIGSSTHRVRYGDVDDDPELRVP